jgi:hypothetical protein
MTTTQISSSMYLLSKFIEDCIDIVEIPFLEVHVSIICIKNNKYVATLLDLFYSYIQYKDFANVYILENSVI